MNTITLDKKKIEFRDKIPNEPEWIYGARVKAWDYYTSSPLPDRAQHLWRYSDPSNFLFEKPERLIKPFPQKSHSNLFRVKLEGEQNNNIIIKDLHSAVAENSDLLNRYLGKAIGGDFGKFEALNFAAWQEGLLIYIPDNTIIERPISIQWEFPKNDFLGRLLVVIGNNSKVTIVDNYSSHPNNKTAMLNNAVELFADDNSEVKYINIQNLSMDSRSYLTQRAQVGAKSKLSTFFALLGGKTSKLDIGTIIEGEGSEALMSGFLLADNKQQFDVHTVHHHKAADSNSNLDYKVILKDKACSSYTGLIRIEQDAPDCEAYQENRNLLLGNGVNSRSIPELEILNQEVSCSHGATMGPVDPEMIYYLNSRGIPTTDAERMIIEGFIEPTFNEIPEEPKELIRRLFFGKLEGEENGR